MNLFKSSLETSLLVTEKFILSHVEIVTQDKSIEKQDSLKVKKQKYLKSDIDIKTMRQNIPSTFACPASSTNTSIRKGNKIKIHLDDLVNLSSIPSFSSFDEDLLAESENEVLQGVMMAILKNENLHEAIDKTQCLLYSLWQKLHTGHWKDVPIGYRVLFSWTSILLVILMLKSRLNEIGESDVFECNIEKKSEDVNVGNEFCSSSKCHHFNAKIEKIILACDRGLLMGYPLCENPLHEVAKILNEVLMGKSNNDSKENKILTIPHIDIHVFPKEVAVFSNASPIDTKDLPSIEDFITGYFGKNKPLVIRGIATEWPALKKWNFDFLRRVAGARTVPVEIGSRYSDEDWSQTLLSINEYIELYCSTSTTDRTASAYLAQHQLFDQIPELLDDLIIPDYCRTSDSEPLLNAWIGPQGTVTPLHHDPDHNILVQIYGYKTLVIFPESDSPHLYPFDDALLNNTSRVNLEELNEKSESLDQFPLLKEANALYATLGPGDGLYMPPKWWHFVKSLTPSISVSFWWK